MMGIFNKNPPTPRYTFIWDVEKVLLFVKSLPVDNSISDKLLSLKLVTLLALTSASRASEICQLDIRYLAKHTAWYSFTLAKPTKTHKPGKTFPVVKYFKFSDDLGLCVCHTIDLYLTRTEKWRKEESQMLLSYISPHKKVSTDTVSRWIKQCIRQAGIDTAVFKAHSTRAASTSKAHLEGVSVSEIMKNASWSNESTFQKFYNKTSESEIGKGFQMSVLNSFKQR